MFSSVSMHEATFSGAVQIALYLNSKSCQFAPSRADGIPVCILIPHESYHCLIVQALAFFVASTEWSHHG